MSDITEYHNTASAMLKPWGLSVQDLIDRAPPIREGEALALAGSIPEGLSNVQSDIDLLYLGDGDLSQKVILRQQGVHDIAVEHDAQGREINVDRLTTRTLSEMRSRIVPAIEMLLNPREKPAFAERDPLRLKMLHRINNCIPLVNPQVLEATRRAMLLEHYPAYVASVSLNHMFNIQEDVVGELQSGYELSARWMVSALLAPALIAAMLASIGETNASKKWHYKLLNRHREELGSANVEGVLGLVSDCLTSTTPVLTQLQDVLEPILREIYARQRAVYRVTTWFNTTLRIQGFGKSQ